MPAKNPARRSFLKRLAAMTTVSAIPAKSALAAPPRELAFYHTHTKKSLSIVYWADGEYLAPALEKINTFLADFRTGDVKDIDPTLLDLIHDLHESLGSKEPYQVISAYRSPKTNKMLRSKSSGVASRSQHLLGTAIDVRLSDVKSSVLRDAALAMKRGGVGFYEKSDFVHVDVGRVRRW
ncbi:MAG: DUF882 domain-containing protein [Woeseiaceae bacterium]